MSPANGIFLSSPPDVFIEVLAITPLTDPLIISDALKVPVIVLIQTAPTAVPAAHVPLFSYQLTTVPIAPLVAPVSTSPTVNSTDPDVNLIYSSSV